MRQLLPSYSDGSLPRRDMARRTARVKSQVFHGCFESQVGSTLPSDPSWRKSVQQLVHGLVGRSALEHLADGRSPVSSHQCSTHCTRLRRGCRAMPSRGWWPLRALSALPPQMRTAAVPGGSLR
eukprot:3412983-Rhodomonas_salina.1